MPHNWQNDALVQELLAQGVSPDDILLIDCPYCHDQTFYSGGFTSVCSWCGEDTASSSEWAYTLEDYLYARDMERYHELEGDTYEM